MFTPSSKRKHINDPKRSQQSNILEAIIPFSGFWRNHRFRELTGSGIRSLNAVSHQQRMRTIKVKIVTGVDEPKYLASLKDISATITTKRASSPP